MISIKICKDCKHFMTDCGFSNKELQAMEGFIACKHFKSKNETNADKIRAMSDEELAEFIPCPHMVNWGNGNYDTCIHPNGKNGCKKCMLEWLRLEAE